MKKGACDAPRPRGSHAFASKRGAPHPKLPNNPSFFSAFLSSYLLSIHMTYCNHVSTIQTLPLSLPTSSSARRRPTTPVFHPHPTTLCLLLAIASTYFITCFKQQSEAATSDTTTHPSELILAYLSFLCSVLGALSGALSTGPVPRIRHHDRPPAFVESPGRPVSGKNAFLLLSVIFQLISPCRSMIQRMWDFPLICTLSSLICLIAQVWLYICIYEPCSVQVVGGIAAATALVALRRLRTSCIIPWTGEHS